MPANVPQAKLSSPLLTEQGIYAWYFSWVINLTQALAVWIGLVVASICLIFFWGSHHGIPIAAPQEAFKALRSMFVQLNFTPLLHPAQSRSLWLVFALFWLSSILVYGGGIWSIACAWGRKKTNIGQTFVHAAIALPIVIAWQGAVALVVVLALGAYSWLSGEILKVLLMVGGASSMVGMTSRVFDWGALALIVWFALWFGLRLALVPQSAVLENRGPISAFRRGWAASESNTGALFWSFIFLALVCLILLGLISLPAFFLLSGSAGGFAIWLGITLLAYSFLLPLAISGWTLAFLANIS